MTRVALTLAAILVATGLHAEDFDKERLVNWHHWRGPLINGTVPNGDPPVSWDAKTNIKWKVALSGKGSSTPIVWGNRLFVTTVVESDRKPTPGDLPKPNPRVTGKTTEPPGKFYKFELSCFDRNTGQLLWRKLANEAVPHEGLQPTHSYCAGSPTTDGQFVYISFGSFGTYCFDFDGNMKWQRDFGRQYTRNGFGEAVTPVVHGDALVLNYDQETDAALYCVDARTGQTRWKADRDERTSWNTPLVVEHDGRTQVIVNASNRIRSYDLATGKELWTCGGMTQNPIPSAVAADGVAYVMSGYGGSLAVAVPLGSTGDLTGTDKFVWRHTRGTPYVASPILAGNRLYFLQVLGAQLTALDTKTGQPTMDRERLPGLRNEIYASPVAAAGRIYIVDREGTTLVLKQGDKLEVLATNRLNDPVDASPVVIGKQLYLRSHSNLYCIENP